MLAPLSRVQEIEYRTLLGLTVFDCQNLRAALQPSACAANWNARRDASLCTGCRIGAIHAGKADAPIVTTPRKPTCCRCGRRDQRLIGNSLCQSCYNRTREVLRRCNCKGKFPFETGSKLREGFAIVAIPNAGSTLQSLFSRHKCAANPTMTAGLIQNHKPGIPTLTTIDNGHVWISSIVTGPEELARIIERLLPGGRVIATDFTESFTERWNAGMTAQEKCKKATKAGI